MPTMQVTTQAQAEVKAQYTLSLDLKVIRALMAEASLNCLLSVRRQLILSRDVVLEDDPDFDEEEDQEDEFEPEQDFGDEDEPMEEDETDTLSIENNVVPWTYEGGYSLYVVEETEKSYRVEVPLCGWEGLVGRTPKGERYVAAVSSRQLVYTQLAAWLEKNQQTLLKAGPFSGQRIKMTQTKLLKEKIFGGAAANLSRYLKNVNLVWPQGSIPLRKLFAD